MKTGILIVFLLLGLFQIIEAQSESSRGIIQESLSVKSSILSHDIKYSVYLPADYGTSERSYPVLYLLHGYTDNETSWIQFGEINAIADKMIANRESVPLIIIMPDAGITYYINSADGKERYEDAFFQEFIPSIEKTYRIRTNREFRAVCGLSMGGFGAMLYALKHPDMFSACLPFSAAIFNDNSMIDEIRKSTSNELDAFGELKGDQLSETWRKNDVIGLVSTLSVQQMSSVKYYIDCGDKDELLLGNSLIHLALNDRKVEHEFRVRSGKHEWSYWRQSIQDGLKFLAPVFRR